MVMRVTRMKVLGLVAALVAGLLSVPAVTAPPAQAMGVKMTGPALRHWAVGKHIGPSAATDYGMMTIVDFRLVGTQRRADGRVKRTWKAVRDLSPCYSCMTQPAGRVHTDSWYNPMTWHWGSIFGDLWNKIVKPCLAGAAAAVGTQASGQVIYKLIMRGATVIVDWQGYATLALGACTWAVYSS